MKAGTSRTDELIAKREELLDEIILDRLGQGVPEPDVADEFNITTWRVKRVALRTETPDEWDLAVRKARDLNVKYSELKEFSRIAATLTDRGLEPADLAILAGKNLSDGSITISLQRTRK